MKKHVVRIALLCVVLIIVSALTLQPLQLVSEGRTRSTLHIGKSVPLVAIAEMAGGYRCYVTEEEYFWLSSVECVQGVDETMRVVFRLQKPAILYRGDV